MTGRKSLLLFILYLISSQNNNTWCCSEIINNKLNMLIKISDEIREDLIREAEHEALTFAEQPQVKLAQSIDILSRQARAHLEKVIKIHSLVKLEQIYDAIQATMPQGLSLFWGSVDDKLLLERTRDFRALLMHDDALVLRLDKAIKDFEPTLKRVLILWSAVNAVYDNITILYEYYEQIEEFNNYTNQALIKNLQSLNYYSLHADKIIRDKIKLVQENRKIDTLSELMLLAEDLIESLGDRGCDKREKIMRVFENLSF